jgi:hypothetical protein
MLAASLNEISFPDPGAVPIKTFIGLVGSHANANIGININIANNFLI